VPLHLHTLRLAEVVAQEPDLAAQLDLGVLPEPLERRLGLGHEATDRERHGGRLVVAAADAGDLTAQLGDAQGVLVGLGGQAGEEVELHPPPALRVGGVDRGVEVLLGDELVDHLAHAPGAGLGGEGEAAAPGPLELGGDADGEGVDPQAREVDRHQPAGATQLVASGEVVDDVVDPGEVGG
jgi:hypothetical protein